MVFNMSLLDKFLDEQNKSFDLSAVATKEFIEHDTRLPPPVLFKYFPKERAPFFQDPSFRFSQAGALNDVFELTRRWEQFAPTAAKKIFSDHLKATFRQLGYERELFFELIKIEALRRGMFLDDHQIAAAREFLRTKNGKQETKRIVQNAILAIDAFVDLAFSVVDGPIGKLDRLASEYGILSMCEIADNKQLWALYASEGTGFCVELDTNNQFFRAPNGRPLIWKVAYGDENEDGFLSNPLALFLKKDFDWQFEREWRSLKALRDCDAAVGPSKDIHIKFATQDLIKSIIFGYRYDAETLIRDSHSILTFDPKIKIRKAVVDRSSRKLSIVDL